MTALTAWRFWKIRKTPKDGSLWLRSLIRSDLWPPMERFEARCTSHKTVNQNGTHPESCSGCGIYAYKTSRYALENLDRFCYRGTLLGRVNLWGVVQKHQFGFRAQFAYPVSLSMGICCMCKRTIHLKSEPFVIGWAYYHFSEEFSVNGVLCEVCNEKYYSLELESGYSELALLTDRYGIDIE